MSPSPFAAPGLRDLQVRFARRGRARAVRQSEDRIAQKIYDSRMEGETEEYSQKLRTQALIEWKDEGYHQMYEKRERRKRAPTCAGSKFL